MFVHAKHRGKISIQRLTRFNGCNGTVLVV